MAISIFYFLFTSSLQILHIWLIYIYYIYVIYTVVQLLLSLIIYLQRHNLRTLAIIHPLSTAYHSSIPTYFVELTFTYTFACLVFNLSSITITLAT